MTDTNVTPTARISFDIVNLPLIRPLAIDAFVLTPVADSKEILRRLKKSEAQSEITAIGTFSLQPIGSADDPFAPLWRPMRMLTLLLSFANRCHIQGINPRLELLVDDQWVWQGVHTSFFIEGRAGAIDWYGGQRQLETFLQTNYPKLNDPAFSEGKGLRLALEFYDQAHSEHVAEMQFLKLWTAMEILYGSSEEGRAKIVSNNRFKRLKSAFEQLLDDAVAAEQLNQSEVEDMIEKLPELNRPSSRRQFLPFCERIFQDYPAQDVTDVEARRFLKIRNEITHGGLMRPAAEDDYMEELLHEKARLKALLERVILALLEESPNLMTFSWRNYRFGR